MRGRRSTYGRALCGLAGLNDGILAWKGVAAIQQGVFDSTIISKDCAVGTALQLQSDTSIHLLSFHVVSSAIPSKALDYAWMSLDREILICH